MNLIIWKQGLRDNLKRDIKVQNLQCYLIADFMEQIIFGEISFVDSKGKPYEFDKFYCEKYDKEADEMINIFMGKF